MTSATVEEIIFGNDNNEAYKKALTYRFFIDLAYQSQILDSDYNTPSGFKTFLNNNLSVLASEYETAEVSMLSSLINSNDFNYTHIDYPTTALGANVQVFNRLSANGNIEEVVVAINGTDLDVSINPYESTMDMLNNGVLVFAGLFPPQLFEVIGIIEAIKNDPQYANVELNITGHSLGGNIVQWIAALRPDLIDHAVAFNPPGIGGVLGTVLNWATFGFVQNLAVGASNITNIQVGGELAEILGINYGKTIKLQYNVNPLDAHTDDLVTIIQNGIVQDQRAALYKYYKETITSVTPTTTISTVTENDHTYKTVKSVYTTIDGWVVTDERTYEIDQNGDQVTGTDSNQYISVVDQNGDKHGDVVLYASADGGYKLITGTFDPNHNQLVYVDASGQEGVLFAYPENADIPFEDIAYDVGTFVSSYYENGEFLHDLLVKSFIQTASVHFGTLVRFLDAGYSLSDAFDFSKGEFDGYDLANFAQFQETLYKLTQANISHAISQAIVDELGETLGLEGIASTAFSTAANVVIAPWSGAAVNFVFNGFNASAFENLELFDWDSTFGLDGFDPVTYVLKYAAGELAGEIISPESQEAALLGSFGALIASKYLSTGIANSLGLSATVAGPLGFAIGAFIGQVAGTIIGNIFAGYDAPAAGAHILYDRDAGEYILTYSGSDDGGSAAVAESMANAAMNGVNHILELTGGALRRSAEAPNVDIGYDDKGQFVIDPQGVIHHFERSGEAIEFAALQMLKSFDLVGGHAILMRAWHNSEATTLEEFQHDIQVAEAFQTYLLNPTGVLALMLNDPESEAAQQWAAILQRAAELELHLPSEYDFDGGWGEMLAARGDINPEAIPDIQGNDIVLTDPVTGEQIRLSHVIGPGYEIIRMPGTDGNDIIQVVVDGPSITYTSAGPGDDTFVGHDGVDIFIGGDGDDTANGGGGNDWLLGGDGNDALYGEAGDDLLVGGNGDDELYGGEGIDEIRGGKGNDLIYGDENADYLYGGDGDDTIHSDGGVNTDFVYGEAGNDTLVTNGYGAWLEGGEGDDHYVFNSGGNAVVVTRDDGHDTVTATLSPNTIWMDYSIGPNDLWFQQDGNDLKILILGEKQSVRIEDFYLYGQNLTLMVMGSNLALNYSDMTALATAFGSLSEQPSGVDNVVSDATLADQRLPNLTTNLYGSLWSTIPYKHVQEIVSAWSLGYSEAQIEAGLSITAQTGTTGFYVGGYGNDTINASTQYNGAQYVAGGAGNDVLYGNNNYNRIFGDSGDDIIYGVHGVSGPLIGGSINTLVGGLGNDYLYGTNFVDDLYGGSGTDTIFASYGNDIIHGGTGNDEIYGQEDNDWIYGQDGEDAIYGGTGNDRIYGGADGDTIEGNAGNDFAYGEEGDDIIAGNEGNDHLSGGAGNDTLSGGAGNDSVSGDDGDDILIYTLADNATAQDIYNGGAGDDTLRIYLTAAEFSQGRMESDLVRYKYALTQNQTNANNIAWTFLLFSLMVNQIEHLEVYVDGVLTTVDYNEVVGTAGGDTLVGSAYHDLISGDEGDDTITGGQGDDEIYGNAGNDIISVVDGWNVIDAGDGDDEITGGSDDDVIKGGAGDDTLFGGAGNDTLSGEDGADTIDAGAGKDIVLGGFGNDTIAGGDGDDDLSGQADNDIITGGLGNDKIDGGSGDDVLTGNEGNDIILGGAGNDTLIGDGDINDTYAGNDELHGGDGNDILYGYKGEDLLYGDSGDDLLYGGDDNDTLYGGTGNDALYGAAGDDILNGGAGDDDLRGSDGNDTLNGDAGNDYIEGGDGNDIIYGGTGNDEISGGAGSDTIDGGAGDDVLEGWDGNDVLRDGAGADTLSGGLGADLFVMNQASLDGMGNIITDFSLVDGDKIVLENLLIDYDGSAIADYIVFEDIGSDMRISIDRDGAATVYSLQELATLSGITGQTPAGYMSSGAFRLEGLTPVVHNDAFQMEQYADPKLTGNLLDDNGSGADFIPDLAPGVIAETITTSHGATVEIHENGDFTYTASIGYYGTDSFTYTVLSETNEEIEGTATITISQFSAYYGTSAGEYLSGYQYVHGNGGYDMIHGTNGNDVIVSGHTGQNSLYGYGGNDIIYGGNMDDGIRGHEGDDILYGLDGIDMLIGGQGADTMTGGAQWDAFLYQAGDIDGSVDTITDFNVADGDGLYIYGILEGYDPVTSAIADFIQITDSGNNSIVSIDVNGGADNFVQFATLEGVTGLTDEQALVTSGNIVIG